MSGEDPFTALTDQGKVEHRAGVVVRLADLRLVVALANLVDDTTADERKALNRVRALADPS